MADLANCRTMFGQLSAKEFAAGDQREFTGPWDTARIGLRVSAGRHLLRPVSRARPTSPPYSLDIRNWKARVFVSDTCAPIF